MFTWIRLDYSVYSVCSVYSLCSVCSVVLKSALAQVSQRGAGSLVFALVFGEAVSSATHTNNTHVITRKIIAPNPLGNIATHIIQTQLVSHLLSERSCSGLT